MLLTLLVIVIGGCARMSARPTSVGTSDGPKPSERNTTGHQPKRLPNIVLRGHARSGALGPVDEPLDGIISFDDALASAEREDPRPDAKTVQVILGRPTRSPSTPKDRCPASARCSRHPTANPARSRSTARRAVPVRTCRTSSSCASTYRCGSGCRAAASRG